MDQFPARADLSTAEGRPSGHCWVFERVEGVPLRFALRPDGRLLVDDAEQSASTAPIPPAAQPAVDLIRSRLDRDALRAGTDVSALTFYGVATCYDRIDYDFDRLPAFLGTDIRVDGDLPPPERVSKGFERVGLTPAPAPDRERRADTIKPGRFDFPEAEWADSEAAGVLIADKHGWRGRLDNDAISDPERPEYEGPADAVDVLLSTELVEAVTGDVVESVRDTLARRHRGDLLASDIDPADPAFRSAIAEAVGRLR